MNQLHLECHNGAAGDMLLAALLELQPNPQQALDDLNAMGLAPYGVKFTAEAVSDHGVAGTHLHVTVHDVEEGHDHPHHDDHHHHHALPDIYALLDGLTIPSSVREDAKAVYAAIARAEGAVHGETPEHVHFHEVGALDAVADVAGVCLLIHRLNPQKLTASPIAVGSGTVRCAHGILPVPAPATAKLLEGLPVTAGCETGELCTPTGAALLRHFCTGFGNLPSMTLLATGHGMGTKRFAGTINAVRALWGQTEDAVAELACNLDDMTGEALAFAVEQLLAHGALDAWTVPITMKKGRPGVTLHCLCPQSRAEEFAAMVFRHTTTLGIRTTSCGRYVLSRRETVEQTQYGPIRVKHAEGFGVNRRKPEFEDVAAIARREGIALSQVVEQFQPSDQPEDHNQLQLE